MPRDATARWGMLALAGAVYFFSYFHRVAPSVVATDLMAAFAITAAALGTLAAIYPYVFAVMGLPAGALADSLGPRRTLALGAAAMAVGSAVFGLAPSFAMAYAGRLLVGLGAAVVLIGTLRLAAAWFEPDEFGLTSGVVMTFGNLGALAASMPLAVSVERLGWRGSFVVIASVTLLLAMAAAIVLRDAPVAGRDRAVSAPLVASLGDAIRAMPGVVTNRWTWPPVLATAGVNGTLLSFFGLWGVPYLVDVHGLTRVEASQRLSLIAIAFVVVAPLVGRLSDRWLGRRRAPFVLFTAGFAACWVMLLWAMPVGVPAWRMGALFFAFGLTASGSFVLVWSCVREVNNPAQVGVALGFTNTPVFATFAVLQWATGAVLDRGWTGAVDGGRRIYPAAAYADTFRLCLGVSVAALVFALFMRETRCRNVWAQLTGRA